MRMDAQTGSIENGLVLIPAQAPWLAVYLDEITTFPASKYDDQVDSTSQALCWIFQYQHTPGILGYYKMLYDKKRREDE
jgi:phage terminase large subunit-like protein